MNDLTTFTRDQSSYQTLALLNELSDSRSDGQDEYLIDILSERVYRYQYTDEWVKHLAIVDFVKELIGSSVVISGDDTDVYRRVGTDTLTYGRTTEWVKVNLIKTLFGSGQQTLPRISVPDLPTQVGDLQLVTIAERYLIDNRGDVMGYLERYAWLPRFLVTAAEMLDRHFPPGVRYILEVFTDPEQEDWDELFVNIRSDLCIDEALDRLDQFDSDWFLDQVDKVGGVVNFSVE